MQARELLNMPAVINMEILCVQIELKHYKELAEKIEKCVSPCGDNAALREINEKITECNKNLHKKYSALIDAESKIAKKVSTLNDERVKTALKYRYLCLMKFEDIADKMAYCTRQVRRFCEKGIEELEQKENVKKVQNTKMA